MFILVALRCYAKCDARFQILYNLELLHKKDFSTDLSVLLKDFKSLITKNEKMKEALTFVRVCWRQASHLKCSIE